MTTNNPQPYSVTIIVLNWNGVAFLPDCLSAIEAQTYRGFQVVVVDNASTDGSVDFLLDTIPDIKLIRANRNLGFAGGNNLALRELAGDIAFLVNPDVVLSPDCLARLVAAMDEDRTIGIAGCKLWYPGGELLQHAGGFITSPRAIPGHFGIREHDTGQYDTPRDVDYVIGAAMAVRRDLLDQIGLFDDDMFLYFEDVDLCTRARQAGRRVMYLPAATAVHVESATAVKGSFTYLQNFHTGRWHYMLKHYTWDEITSATVPAEQTWLESTGLRERLAAGTAYRAALYHWPAIAAKQAPRGDDLVQPEEAWTAIEESLLALYDQAWRTETLSPNLKALLERSLDPPQGFTSQAPVIGGFIAGLRTAWNNISGRWYVNDIYRQQEEINQLVIQELTRLDQDMRERQLLVDELIRRQISLRREARAVETLINQR